MFKFLKPYWMSITFNYTIAVVQVVLYLMRPLLIGRMIEELIKERALGNATIACISLEIVHIGLHLFKEVMDVFVFERIMAKIAVNVAEEGNKKDLPISTIQGRALLAGKVSGFLEYGFPKCFKSLLCIIGSFIGLAYFGWWLLPLNFGMVIVAILIIPRTITLIAECANDKHDNKEKDTEVFSTRCMKIIREHMNSYVNIAIRKVKADTTCVGVMLYAGMVCSYISVIGVCLLGADIGAAYSVYKYSSNLDSELDKLQLSAQLYAEVKDITNRF